MTLGEIELLKNRGLNVGENCDFVSPGPNFGSEPYLITIGDNTTVSFDVAFVTHDAGTRVLRNLAESQQPTTKVRGLGKD